MELGICDEFSTQIAIYKDLLNEEWKVQIKQQGQQMQKGTIQYDHNIHKGHIYCNNDHQLQYHHYKQGTSYFRHKTQLLDDDKCHFDMSQYHLEWQSLYDEIEVEFRNQNGQKRRADIKINDKCVIEIQKSYISKEKVQQRTQFYKNLQVEVIWIINCDYCVIIEEDYIIFSQQPWRIQNFENIIYLQVGDYLYQVNANELYNKIVYFGLRLEKQEFIKVSKSLEYKYLLKNTQSQIPNITCIQRGAGTGKTYEICLLINDMDKKHNVIYLSKTHSAIFTIFEQIIKLYITSKLNIDIQIKNETNLEIIQRYQFIQEDKVNLDDFEFDEFVRGKQYVLSYKYKTEERYERQIIIGTIDSFYYALKNKEFKHKTDYFADLAQSISGQKSLTNPIYKKIRIDVQSIIIVDEVQDLPLIYGQALKSIQEQTNIDLYMVGDYLQSIYFKDNAMELFDINNGSNNVIRFKDDGIKKFVNNVVNFDKFSNRQVVQIQNINDQYAKTHCIQLKQQWKVQPEQIIKIFKQEVGTYPEPSDYMIITPFVQKNYWLDGLRIKLEEFWQQIYPLKKQKFVEFHKSQENKPIDLKSSNDKTRIQSIHSSKGTGRNVVIVVDLSEANLLKFSDQTQNIVYESLLYVALTRQKKSLYVFYQNDQDDIGSRMNNNCIVKPVLEKQYSINRITEKFQMSKFVKWIVYKMQQENDDEFTELMDQICDEKVLKFSGNQSSQVIDYNHHIIRYQVLVFQFQRKLFQSWEQDIADFIKRIKIETKDSFQYMTHMTNTFKNGQNEMKKFDIALLRFDSKDKSKEYYNEAYEFLNKNIVQMKQTKTVGCFVQMFIFQYLYNWVYGLLKDYPILELYDMLLWYKKSFIQLRLISDHSQCLCEQIPVNSTINTQDEKLVNFYGKLTQIDDMVQQYKQIVNENPEQLKYNELIKMSQFKLWETYPLQTSNTITLFIQQLSLLNFKETIIKSAVSQLFNNDMQSVIVSFDEDIQTIHINPILIESLQQQLNNFIKEQCLIYNQQVTDYLRNYLKEYNEKLKQQDESVQQQKERTAKVVTKFKKLIQSIINDNQFKKIPSYIRNQIGIYSPTLLKKGSSSLAELHNILNNEIQRIYLEELDETNNDENSEFDI